MAHAPFLALDGLDGSGKSTQCRLLADSLRGKGLEVIECADPGGTAVGEQIRDILLVSREESYRMSKECEALLFMASRAQLVAEVIAPALAAGRVVVSDRFLLANVVYQGYGCGLDPQKLWQIGSVATAGLEPDLTVVLDMKPELALARRPGPKDRLERRELAFHVRVREGFLTEARACPKRIKVVDADASVEVVHERICREVAFVLGKS